MNETTLLDKLSLVYVGLVLGVVGYMFYTAFRDADIELRKRVWELECNAVTSRELLALSAEIHESLKPCAFKNNASMTMQDVKEGEELAKA